MNKSMNKKLLLVAALLLAATLLITFIKRTRQSGAKAIYTIGILQTASHPALDAVREGYIDTLTNKLGNTIHFITHNAQGSVSQAYALAQQLSTNKQFTGFFAVGTPAAQALSSVEKKRPIALAAVTDPQGLGLLDASTTVYGTKDMIDVKAQVDLLTTLLPEAKTIGLLYTSGETNSLSLVELMRTELTARGLNTVDFAISNEADMHAVVDLAARKSDVLLAPTDNTVASAIALVAKTALKHKKPLLVSDNMLVRFGALAARGVDYKESGNQTAHLTYRVLVEGEKPSNLPIEQAKSEQVFINKATLDALGLSVPAKLQQQAVLV